MIQHRTNTAQDLIPDRLPQDEWRDAWTSPEQTDGRLSTPEDGEGKPVVPRELYRGVMQPFQYGPNDDLTYKLAGNYLSGPGLVEDWGCGTTWARRYIGAPYRGVDAAPSLFADTVADLRTYDNGGNVPKILLRHVLEHNWDWRDVLENMLNSFTDRAALLLHLRPGPEDTNMYRQARSSFDVDEDKRYVPALSLCEDDLENIIKSGAVRRNLAVYTEEMQTDIESQYERIYWLERRP